jgi:hypothetical protein
MALIRGLDQATPQEVYDVAYDILNGRLALSYLALAEGFTVDDILVDLLSTVPAPALITRHAGSWPTTPATPSAPTPATVPTPTTTQTTPTQPTTQTPPTSSTSPALYVPGQPRPEDG